MGPLQKVESIIQAVIISRKSRYDCLLPSKCHASPPPAQAWWRQGRGSCGSSNDFGSMRLVTAVGLALGAFLTILLTVASTGYHDWDDTSQPRTRKTRTVHIPESHCETPVAIHLSDMLCVWHCCLGLRTSTAASWAWLS